MFTRIAKKILPALSLGLLLVCMQTSAYAGKQAMKVYDKGMVDGARFYHVVCEDGRRVSVRHMFEIPAESERQINPGMSLTKTPGQSATAKSIEICADTYAGKTQCKTNWTVDKAAKYACKNK